MIANLSTRLALTSLSEIEDYDNESSLLNLLTMCLAMCSLISPQPAPVFFPHHDLNGLHFAKPRLGSCRRRAIALSS